MKMTPDIRMQILMFLADETKPTPAGHVCRFLRLNDKLGAKIYGNSIVEIEKAKKAHASQAKAFGQGLAPEPGEYFNIRMRLGSSSSVNIHGYLTEAVNPCRGSDYDALYELDRKMVNAGYSTGDLREANCGWTNEGELVCVDWDPLSMVQ